MWLGGHCPQALPAATSARFAGLDLDALRLAPRSWRAFADTLEAGSGGADAPPPRVGPAAVLAELDPAPLPGHAARTRWRDRLGAWVLARLRSLFGPDTALGRWLEGLTAEDLRSFSAGVLAVVLVLFGLLVAGLALLLYRALAGRRGGSAPRRVELPEALAEVPLLAAERIRELPAARQPLALMRLALARIDAAGLCATRASMTNAEVASALRRAADLHIDALARLADRCLFAGHEATAAELDPCWDELAALERRA